MKEEEKIERRTSEKVASQQVDDLLLAVPSPFEAVL